MKHNCREIVQPPSRRPATSSGCRKATGNRTYCDPRRPPAGILANVRTALSDAPEWQGVLAFNERTQEIIAKAKPPFRHSDRRSVPFLWTDSDAALTLEWCEHQGILAKMPAVWQAIMTVAQHHSFNPVKDYLDSLI